MLIYMQIAPHQWLENTYSNGNEKPNYFPISFSNVMNIQVSLQHNLDGHADSLNWYYLTNKSVYLVNAGGGNHDIFVLGI